MLHGARLPLALALGHRAWRSSRARMRRLGGDVVAVCDRSRIISLLALGLPTESEFPAHHASCRQAHAPGGAHLL